MQVVIYRERIRDALVSICQTERQCAGIFGWKCFRDTHTQLYAAYAIV